jgi:hypothetical protein
LLESQDDVSPLGTVIRGAILGTLWAGALLIFPLIVGIGYSVVGLLSGSTAEALGFVAFLPFGLTYMAIGATSGAVGGLVWNIPGPPLRYILVGLASMFAFAFLLVWHEEGHPGGWDNWDWGFVGLATVAFGLTVAFVLYRDPPDQWLE